MCWMSSGKLLPGSTPNPAERLSPKAAITGRVSGAAGVCGAAIGAGEEACDCSGDLARFPPPHDISARAVGTRTVNRGVTTFMMTVGVSSIIEVIALTRVIATPTHRVEIL